MCGLLMAPCPLLALYLSYADVEGTTWATIAYITALTIHTHACAMHEPQLYDQPSHRVHSSSRTCHLWRRASMSAPRSSSRSSISDEPATCSAVGKAQRNIGRLSAELISYGERLDIGCVVSCARSSACVSQRVLCMYCVCILRRSVGLTVHGCAVWHNRTPARAATAGWSRAARWCFHVTTWHPRCVMLCSRTCASATAADSPVDGRCSGSKL